MPGSTPIYGFPYPLGSDPVRDGDNVIRSLAEDVETELDTQNIAINSVQTTVNDSMGLWLVNTVTFTNSLNADVLDVFSSLYENYVAEIVGVYSIAGSFTGVQLLNGTTPKTTLYDRSGFFTTPTTALTTSAQGVAQSSYIIQGQNTTVNGAKVTFYKPNVNTRTVITSTAQYGSVNWGSGGIQNEDYVATGFRILPIGNAATFTGTVRVYGYRN